MPVTFYSDLYPHYEALLVISNLVNEVVPRKMYDKFVKSGRTADADALMGDLLAVFDHVESNYDVSNPKLIDFFKFWGENIYDDLSFATTMASPYIPNHIPQMLQSFKEKNETEQKKIIAKTLLTINEEQPEIPISFDSVIKKIDSMPISSDLKFRLVKAYNNYYDDLCYLSGVLDDVSVLVSEKLKPLQEKATEVMFDLEKNSNHSMDYISKIIDMRLTFSTETVIDVFPTSFVFGVSVNDIDNGGQEMFNVIWGTRLEQILQIKKEIEKNSDKATDSLRILSEKTKFEILSALLNGPMYGTELAQKLELTGATVSHHVNGLLLHNLICANPEQNKIYYSINKQRIKELLIGIEKHFEG